MILERKAKINLDQYKFDKNRMEMPKDELIQSVKELLEMQQIYSAAIKEVSTKLEILDDEFHVKHEHNPIHHMECRIKQPQSMMSKLEKLGVEANLTMASEHLNDIAGIRVICNYIDDVYKIAELLLMQSDITLIKLVDYIENPKPNGYRSLHIVVEVPVFLSDGTKRVSVEVQIRTIAMDFWASLEHQLRYKAFSKVDESLQEELMECAQNIAAVDCKMQEIYKRIHTSGDAEHEND